MKLFPIEGRASRREWSAWIDACGGSLVGYLQAYKGQYSRAQIINIFAADQRARRKAVR